MNYSQKLLSENQVYRLRNTLLNTSCFFIILNIFLGIDRKRGKIFGNYLSMHIIGNVNIIDVMKKQTVHKMENFFNKGSVWSNLPFTEIAI